MCAIIDKPNGFGIYDSYLTNDFIHNFKLMKECQGNVSTQSYPKNQAPFIM